MFDTYDEIVRCTKGRGKCMPLDIGVPIMLGHAVLTRTDTEDATYFNSKSLIIV